MKRLLFIPLIFICSTLWAGDPTECKEPIQLARMNPYIAGAGVSAAAGCSTSKDGDITTATADAPSFVNDGSNDYVAGKITVTSSYTVCKIEARIYKVNSPTFKLRAAIYSDDSGPNTVVGTASDEVDVSTFASEEATVAFTGLSASVSSGTYYVVIYYSSGTKAYYNHYVKFAFRGGGSGDHYYKDMDGVAPFTDVSGYYLPKVLLYSN